MKCIVSVNEDNSVKIIHPSFKEQQRLQMTEDEFINFIIEKDVDKSKFYKVIDKSELPTREKRNQWKWNGDKIVVM